jgi:hypothetical protein
MELPSFEAFMRAGWILFLIFGSLVALNGVRIFIRNRWFLEKDFFGDKITGKWIASVKPGARDLHHSFSNDRCNYCGQKNLCVLEYEHFPWHPAKILPNNTRDYLCGSCGCKYNASLYEVEVKVLRECTDPIHELRRPATHGGAIVTPHGLGVENRINVCKTCDGSKFVKVPSSVNTGELWGEWDDAPCPDCYTRNNSAPAAAKSARRRAIEHTRAKVSAEEADRLKEP